ncbi:MAG: hypothetical protein HYX69_19265 [Planctomycetia bacterium]|nr:hypothetical protein [Planctomycetia bacterium]
MGTKQFLVVIAPSVFASPTQRLVFDYAVGMARQMALLALLLWSAALPIGISLLVAVPSSPGWGRHPLRFAVAPLVLCGTTTALHRLMRGYRNAWAASALLAAAMALGALSIAVAFSESMSDGAP